LDIFSLILPEESKEEDAVVLECRAGTGGDEASIFNMDMVRMYERYCIRKNWKFEILEAITDGRGKGLKVDFNVHR
jgi:peptide chain release factor 1